MGTVLLGALLGANQSFESFSGSGGTAPESWATPGSQSAFSAVTSATQVHSSVTGLLAQVESTGGSLAVLLYGYDGVEDTARWFPDVTTHAVLASVWVRAADAPSSGHLRLRLEGQIDAIGAPIAHGGALARTALETMTASPAALALQLERINAAMPAASVLLDDVLTIVDALTLSPDWHPLLQRWRVGIQHRAANGAWLARDTGRYWRAAMTLPSISTAQADQLVWWWEQRLPLALTLDTSDSATTLLCQLSGDTPPVSQRLRPYSGRYRGLLRLESLDGGSLMF